MLTAGGWLMLCCNSPTLSALGIDEMVREAIPAAVLEQRLEASPDVVEKKPRSGVKSDDL
jgi:hypothetical protein